MSKYYKGWYAQVGLVPPQHRDSELNFGELPKIHTPLEITITSEPNGCDFTGDAKINGKEHSVRGDFTQKGMRVDIPGEAYLTLERHSEDPNLFLGPCDIGVTCYCRLKLESEEETSFAK